MLFSIGLQNAAVATLLAVLVWGFTRFVKNPPVAHVLWLLVLAKLVTPPLVLFDLWPTELKSASQLQIQGAEPTVAGTLRMSESPFSDLGSPSISVGQANSSPAPAESIHSKTAEITEAGTLTTLMSAWNVARPALPWIWVGGIGCVALLAGIRIVRFQRMLAGLLPVSQRLQAVTDELASRIGLQRSPHVSIVDSAAVPMVWCLGRRATVVLPVYLLGTLSEQQTAMVIAHELAHLRRRDHWVRVFELTVSVLYWWNPLVWWVRRQLHAVEEQSCDAWVAWICPDQSHVYAESLLKAAQLEPRPSSIALLASPFLNTHTLKERIEMVLTNRSPRSASRSALICLLTLAALVIPTGVRGIAEEPVPQTNPAAVTATIPSARDEKSSDLAAQPAPVPLPNGTADKPIAKSLQPFQGTWNFDFYRSLKWSAGSDTPQSWTIQGDQITWQRAGQAAIRLSFAIDPEFTRDPKKWPNDIEFTILDGPDKGQKCLGSFYWFANTETLWFCFQDPGAQSPRLKKMSFNGHDRLTVISMNPGQPALRSNTVGQSQVPIIDPEKAIPSELQDFQGAWTFGLCDSELWYTDLDVIRKSWRWTIQGRELTWTRDGKEAVRLSISVDPTKEPNQIDFTYLDGPDKGTTCQAIYEFERESIWVCMAEPGAKIDRPDRMSMSSGSQRALIILHPKHNDPAVSATQVKVVPAAPPPAANTPKPAVPKQTLLQGSYLCESLFSEKWTTTPEEYHTWKWAIQGQEIVWTRPNREDLRLSFTFDPTVFPKQIDLTFLTGPDKGKKCLGIYFASRHEITICFPDPGANVGRPTNTGSTPGSQLTSIRLVPAEVLPAADEVRALQGLWHFDIYYSNWWPGRINNPPVGWSNWSWKIKGNEITWTGIKGGDVKLSFTIDPSKSPRQIDLTFLDGPHQGKKLLGIYKFYYEEDGCYLCFADPDAHEDRPTEVSYSGQDGHHTMVAIERTPTKSPSEEAPPTTQVEK